MKPEEFQRTENELEIAEDLVGFSGYVEPTTSKPKSTTTKASSPRGNKNRKCYILEGQGFIVGKTLGAGSYATVKSAYDVNRKHNVAIKMINKKKAFEEYLQKFLPREIETIKSLSHPRIVTFYQIIETTSRFFFVMELTENGDLLEEIKKNKWIEEAQAGIWFRQLHEGLFYMHSNGICHRDIKCEICCWDSDRNLKITDFGFSKKAGKTKYGDLSKTYCGSYAYAPPEILKGIPYDPYKAEVWNIGVVLFTMVHGSLPFDDSDHKKLLKQVQKKVVFPPKPIVSSSCRKLILKILTKAPDRVPMKAVPLDPWFKSQVMMAGEDAVENKLDQAEETVLQSSLIQQTSVISTA